MLNDAIKISNNNSARSLSALLKSYQQRIERSIEQHLPSFHGKGALSQSCEYALLNGGKRFRPALVYMVADALGHSTDVTAAALGIEYFHTASLIADDLPCMDDDDERRNKPSVHKVYGEAVALLTSYTLIAAGYQCIFSCVEDMKKTAKTRGLDCNHIGMLALENATHNTGMRGATGGQYLDIFPPNLNLPTIREVIHKKTVSLFEISFVFGWLFGCGDIGLLPQIKKTTSHFGMAFQIADDLGDVEQDAKNGRKVNVAGIFGIAEAQRMFHEEISGYRSMLKVLGLESSDLLGLADLLDYQVRYETRTTCS